LLQLRREEVRRDLAFAEAVELDPRVHVRHRRLVDSRFQRAEFGDERRRPLLQLGAVDEDGVVLREVGEVVFEPTQLKLANLRVGRVKVGDLDHALVKRFVGQGVLQPPHVLMRQLIPLRQCAPAIRTLHELVAEA